MMAVSGPACRVCADPRWQGNRRGKEGREGEGGEIGRGGGGGGGARRGGCQRRRE